VREAGVPMFLVAGECGAGGRGDVLGGRVNLVLEGVATFLARESGAGVPAHGFRSLSS
jgi:hypothetical protein